jgi:hypothetical protein
MANISLEDALEQEGDDPRKVKIQWFDAAAVRLTTRAWVRVQALNLAQIDATSQTTTEDLIEHARKIEAYIYE